ncbi:hypothetical protein AVEN_23600-1 [Araneus ventricosus]|uniref:Uncharacterized protein n=1 Tax=Araneus ventricosus TaxID=182803 RepID=A0A4Y2BIW9_ARAVE|nr:hypothetical protein AVEN_23600-1 [Araneus ventricosus]
MGRAVLSRVSGCPSSFSPASQVRGSAVINKVERKLRLEIVAFREVLRSPVLVDVPVIRLEKEISISVDKLEEGRINTADMSANIQQKYVFVKPFISVLLQKCILG